jgi:general secretion pathway protein K
VQSNRVSVQPIKSKSRETGFVIIVVLMVVFLMVTLLTYMIEKQHVLIRRIANQNISEQGYQYAQGVNAWAERVLHDDINRQVDYLGEDWATFGKDPEEADQDDESFSLKLSSQKEEEEQAAIDFGIEGLEYSIIDLQSRYNLNNLNNRNPALRSAQKRVFLNLLELLEIGELQDRESLYAALFDWLDENDLEVVNGVESGFYKVKNTPYYAADQKLTSLGELRYVEGFTREVIRKLKPYVTVLPIDNARININTTSTEVLSSLSSVPVVDVSSVAAFLAIRSDENFLGFSQAATEQAKLAIIGVSPVRRIPVANMMQANSQFFQINTKVMLGDFQYCMRTIVLREMASPSAKAAPKVSVLNRQHDTLCDDQIPVQDSLDE